MPDIKGVHERIREKRRERNEINRSFKDELAHDSEYQEIIEELKTLKERKKGIEDRVKANASADATKADTLGLEIKADSELLADLAINTYVEGKSVAFDDDGGQRWVPAFSVRFTKDEGSTAKMQAEEERAASHPERTFAPVAEEALVEAEERVLEPA